VKNTIQGFGKLKKQKDEKPFTKYSMSQITGVFCIEFFLFSCKKIYAHLVTPFYFDLFTSFQFNPFILN